MRPTPTTKKQRSISLDLVKMINPNYELPETLLVAAVRYSDWFGWRRAIRDYRSERRASRAEQLRYATYLVIRASEHDLLLGLDVQLVGRVVVEREPDVNARVLGVLEPQLQPNRVVQIEVLVVLITRPRG